MAAATSEGWRPHNKSQREKVNLSKSTASGCRVVEGRADFVVQVAAWCYVERYSSVQVNS